MRNSGTDARDSRWLRAQMNATTLNSQRQWYVDDAARDIPAPLLAAELSELRSPSALVRRVYRLTLRHLFRRQQNGYVWALCQRRQASG